jgi:peptidyl-prolyl cis-trans isomerase C
MRNATRFLAVAAAMLAASCSHRPPAGETADIVATVNGKTISRSTFNEFVKGVVGKAATELAPEQRAQLLDNIVRAEVVAAEAERSGLATKEAVRYALDMARLQVLQSAVSQEFLKGQKASDEEIRAEYAQRYLAAGGSQPPAIELVRDQLARFVEEKKFHAYVDTLIARSKVTKSL